MIRLAALLAVLGQAAPEYVHKATLVFEAMHCDECRIEIEAVLKKVRGFKAVATEENRVILTFEEKAPIPAFSRVPKDLRLKEVTVEIAGTVSFSDKKSTLVARGSGEALSLVNPEKPEAGDRLEGLRRALGGKNRFLIRGTLSAARTVVLGSFEPADWKDK